MDDLTTLERIVPTLEARASLFREAGYEADVYIAHQKSGGSHRLASLVVKSDADSIRASAIFRYNGKRDLKVNVSHSKGVLLDNLDGLISVLEGLQIVGHECRAMLPERLED